jgi:cytochrome c peroxidase
MKKRWLALPLIVVLIAVLSASAIYAKQHQEQPALTPLEQLGKSLFFDTQLSLNDNQSCSSCHGPAWGFTGPIPATNAGGSVYEGSVSGQFGNRKPPSAAYATFSPILYMDKKGLWVGGNFWDGRATGEKLGNPAADQAQGPFLNNKEQALPSVEAVIQKLKDSKNPDYQTLFDQVWGIDITDPDNTQEVFDDVALSISAYEASFEVNAFTSKFDYARKGMAKLTKEEQIGFALFNGKANCNNCHIDNGQGPLFTDFTFDNLGVPKNPDNPVYNYDPGFVDYGLGGYLESQGYSADIYTTELGKEKVPTLRNVDRRVEDGIKAYGHNGYFKSLEEIVHFYNTRDVEGAGWDGVPWPAPEVAQNVNKDELGNLGLSSEEEAAIVAFLKTLSDGYSPTRP